MDPAGTSSDPSVDVVPAVEDAPAERPVEDVDVTGGPGDRRAADAPGDRRGGPAGAPDAAVRAEVVEGQAQEEPPGEQVDSPAKVMRIGSMIKQLLDEVRSAPLDDASRERLRDIYDTSVRELASALSPDLQEELSRMALPFDVSTPSDAELRIAQATLVGWLEGLFHGIQATLFAQQMAARQQLEQMHRQRGLPPGVPGEQMGEPPTRPGTYL